MTDGQHGWDTRPIMMHVINKTGLKVLLLALVALGGGIIITKRQLAASPPHGIGVTILYACTREPLSHDELFAH